MNKYIPILFISIALTACVTTERFEKRYKTWIGNTKTKLINAYGEPQNIINNPNGTYEYSYNLSKSKKAPLPDTCILNFIISSKDIITGIKYKGNYCRRGPSFA